MDIENMHPFCLPFGFCHDATSSSMTPEFALLHNNNNNNISSSNSTSTNNDKKDKLRSISSSPTDELLRHLNSTSSLLSSGSLLHDDLINIESPSALDISRDVESFYSLELDIDIDTSSPNGSANNNNNNNASNSLLDSEFMNDDSALKSNQDDNWYCNQFSLFSPISPTTSSSSTSIINHQQISRRKSFIKAALTTAGIHHHNQQVFQHVVDPIDIKSSPTLAQLNLNLNSNDDMTDSLWDSTSTSNNHSDLLSNCTSISVNHLLHGSNTYHHHHHHHQSEVNDGSTLICNHLHHRHRSEHNHHHLTTSSFHLHQHPAHQSNSSTACHHIAHHSNQHHHLIQQQSHHDTSCTRTNSMSCSSTDTSSCLRASSSGKSDPQQYTASCCHNSLAATNTSNNLNNNNNNGQNLKRSANLNQSEQPCGNNNTVLATRQLATIDTHQNSNLNNQKLSQQQRAASPALVTSSSSPLSSSAVSLSNENKPVDNKLKENIEYLTALLCNGNKLDQQQQQLQHQQQPTISSTMVRSYSTLAQSLATGPKLLERSSQIATGGSIQNQHLHLHQHQYQQLNQFSTLNNHQHQPSNQNTHQTNTSTSHTAFGNCSNPTNEASPSAQEIITSHQNSSENHIMSTANQAKRPYPDQWFKLAVETSVSAADSTESQVSSQLANSTTNHPSTPQTTITAVTNNSQVVDSRPLHHCHSSHTQGQHLIHPPVDDTRTQKSTELKVLSSLLSTGTHANTNKCITSQQKSVSLPSANNNANPNLLTSNKWHQQDHQQQQQQHHHHHHQLQQQHQIHHHSPHHHPSSHPHPPLPQQHQHHLSNSNTQIVQPSSSVLESVATQMVGNEQQPVKQEHLLTNSIPPNGKPITLTPISTSSSIIVQQHQKSKATLFVQPASPSASSTASSVGAATCTTSTEVSSLAQTHPTSATKRQRGNNLQVTAKQTGATSARSGRPNSLSTDCSLSSHDEGSLSQIDNDDCGSNRDSDEDEDVDSDDESFYGDYTNSDLIGASISDNAENKWTLNMGRSRRNGQKRYFWQYNVQSKGPKGTRICSTDDSEDPFVLPEASDPVFSNDCQVEGVKHSGKARRGDGNDLTPNPRKLLMIGLELKKLSKIINDLAPVIDLPINARNKTRKEKNKLASRACRLKKKAQHEANKIKLYGLQREHQQVVLAIYDVRKLLNETLIENDKKKLSTMSQQQQQGNEQQQTNFNQGELSRPDNGNNVNLSIKTIAEQCSMNVAGQTSDYVNSVLEKVVSGCIDGGLQT